MAYRGLTKLWFNKYITVESREYAPLRVYPYSWMSTNNIIKYNRMLYIIYTMSYSWMSNFSDYKFLALDLMENSVMSKT